MDPRQPSGMTIAQRPDNSEGENRSYLVGDRKCRSAVEVFRLGGVDLPGRGAEAARERRKEVGRLHGNGRAIRRAAAKGGAGVVKKTQGVQRRARTRGGLAALWGPRRGDIRAF